MPLQHNLLTQQHRMHADNGRLVSEVFYEGTLTTAAATAASRKRFPSVQFVDVRGREEKINNSYKNDAEAREVVDIVRRERDAHPDKLINVITFHRPQMFAISDALRRVGLLGDSSTARSTARRTARRTASASSAASSAQLDVITVDSMQGREADIVILSCARTHGYGFLKDLQRLNVALSRSREMLYIVGNTQLFEREDTPDAWRRGVRFVRDLQVLS
jgi:superfamily I DNA and/or RNA helicase